MALRLVVLVNLVHLCNQLLRALLTQRYQTGIWVLLLNADPNILKIMCS